MISLIIFNDYSLFNVINLQAFYFKEPVFLVPKRSMQDKLYEKGLEAHSGNLAKSFIYKRIGLEDIDIIFILIQEDNLLLDNILKLLGEIAKGIPVIALYNEEDDPTLIQKYPEVRFIPLFHSINSLFSNKIQDVFLTKRVEELRLLFRDTERLLILIQHDPDPDAIASALALRTLLGRNKATAPIGSFGKVTRPENHAMLKLLEIEVEQIDEKTLKEYSKIAMVDVQPSYFNDLLPQVDAVIDHHPPQKGYKASFRDIRVNYGATSTILTEYLLASDVKIPQRLATALFYGIKTDTFYLDREVNNADIRAFSYLYPLSNRNLLRRIERPELPIDALKSFGKTIQQKVITNGVLFSHLGDVEREDVIPYLADFCLQVEDIEWAVVSGVFDKKIVICVRNSGFTKSAGEAVKEAFGEIGSAGGHRAMAKAVIPLKSYEEKFGKPADKNIKDFIKKSFIKAMKEKSKNPKT
jgi:nanoRNase/pAp phosphatase (c-di-AMP/oligoRNAs hydrolase)